MKSYESYETENNQNKNVKHSEPRTRFRLGSGGNGEWQKICRFPDRFDFTAVEIRGNYLHWETGTVTVYKKVPRQGERSIFVNPFSSSVPTEPDMEAMVSEFSFLLTNSSDPVSCAPLL